ncbi:hypothetical protein; putative exported protein [Xenorhabdus nematophila ATCC 19061]|uniref:Uncharacterized protein n=1 Tax=Xenorhabdus nematophila (strain ATCC 19061 / DSM 3370 / CCUG 14189 / LMG 1036 / NCIMB 9965 / AN6) TaxID=406817 RepID=D3VGZ7_XENNA|nr:hypothetical protein; putative exported protein [Xenorhabdus nematophila ATCC 19061]
MSMLKRPQLTLSLGGLLFYFVNGFRFVINASNAMLTIGGLMITLKVSYPQHQSMLPTNLRGAIHGAPAI